MTHACFKDYFLIKDCHVAHSYSGVGYENTFGMMEICRIALSLSNHSDEELWK